MLLSPFDKLTAKFTVVRNSAYCLGNLMRIKRIDIYRPFSASFLEA